MATMKALVFHGPRDMRYEDVPKPVPKAGEVLVKVKAVSICGSDISGYKGGNAFRVAPLIMGHEFSGEIAELGEGVTEVNIGDRCVIETNLYCKTCPDCLNNLSNVCDNRYIIGTTMPAGSYNGAMSEYVVAPAEKVIPLADHVSFNDASLAEPLSIAFRALNNSSGVKDKTVAVFGAGPIGLMSIACIKAAGAKNIIAVDLVESRLDWAVKMGATHTINAKEDVYKYTRELTNGTGVDIVLDAAGVESTVNTGIEIIRNGGEMLLVGLASPKINIEFKHAVCKELKLIGNYLYTTELQEALDAITAGSVDIGALVTGVYHMSEGARVFEELASGNTKDIKVILSNDI
jgi:2-desacetyl-2-hydroxyethyl bacteriochlorophyllide A dehydrogenase